MRWAVVLPLIDFWFAFGLLVIFGAAVVRGFSGFGFSLLAVSALSLVYPLNEVIAPIMLMELAASINLLPAIWRDVHWRSIGVLLCGTVIGTPLGVWMLTVFPPAPMQLTLSIFVVATVLLLRLGFQFKTMPGPGTTLSAGLASGLTNGAFGIGGPPAILFYFSSPAAATVGRASLTAYFFAIDVVGLTNLWLIGDFVDTAAFIRAAVWLPALVAGVWIGHHTFKNVDESVFRKTVQLVIFLLALVLGAKAVVTL